MQRLVEARQDRSSRNTRAEVGSAVSPSFRSAAMKRTSLLIIWHGHTLRQYLAPGRSKTLLRQDL
eukprot:354393-Rhodomonas_salina.3